MSGSTFDGYPTVVYGDFMDGDALIGIEVPTSDSYAATYQALLNGRSCSTDVLVTPEGTFTFYGVTDYETADNQYNIEVGFAYQSVVETPNPCFVLGTSLDTPDGPFRVEDLQVDDVVSTLSGPARVRWIGHRRATDVDVIRIRPHALGENQPRREFCVSDDHALFLEGVLVPAGALVDGIGIVRERWEAVTFYHVELEAHAILLAEGAPAESYIDTGNRRQFGNCPLTYDPISATQDHCAELVIAGERLERIRAKLGLTTA